MAETASHSRSENWRLNLFIAVSITVASIILVAFASSNPFSLTEETYFQFHTFFEVLSVVICLSIYVVAGFRYEQTSEWQDLNLSMTFLVAGLLHFAHGMSSPGLDYFITPNSLQKAAVFDSMARLAMAAGLLFFVAVKPHFIRHRWPLGICTLGTFIGTVAMIVFVSYYAHVFPSLYLLGENDTAPKFASEVLIMLISLVALVFAVMGRITGEARTALLITLLLLIFVGIFMYSRVIYLDTFNIFAHIYKFLAFITLFWWLFVSAIRALYQANEQLSNANKALARSNRLKSEILANTSHELRTPLTSIMAFSELLLDKHTGKLNPVQEDYIHEINDSAAALLRQINNILNLSKVEAGKLVLNLELTDPVKLVQDTVSSMRALFHKQGLTVEVVNNFGDQMLHLDADKIKQVLINLLSNAAKFTPAGGKVTITLSRTDHSPPKLRITVRDSGVGIPPEHIKKVFHKFYQVENVPSRLFRGSGLGLTVARHIVMAHGGTIDVDSTPGQGTVFTIDLCIITEEMIEEAS
ncbi:MAG: ATP-binding protein [Bacillota bacterium]